MSEHTTFKVGGPADIYVIPDDADEVHDVLEECKSAFPVPFKPIRPMAFPYSMLKSR